MERGDNEKVNMKTFREYVDMGTQAKEVVKGETWDFGSTLYSVTLSWSLNLCVDVIICETSLVHDLSASKDPY